MIVKVKEPQAQEIALLEPRHILFTYLHLAADKPQAEGLMKSGATCIAYETVTSRIGALPLLKPMSEVAGRMSIQVGAHYLEKEQGGRGVLLGGVPGRRPGQGRDPRRRRRRRQRRADGGRHARRRHHLRHHQRAAGRARHVLRLARSRPPTRRATRSPTRSTKAELVIGAVLVPGAAAPKLVTREMLKTMKRGSRAGRHRDRPGRLLRDQPRRRPTPTRSTRSTASSIIASPTCPARWRGPAPSRSTMRPCRSR